jgi:hypothetical protein
MSQAAITEAALEDEKRFIDHSRLPASLTRLVHSVVD